jgi:DNA polymerase V
MFAMKIPVILQKVSAGFPSPATDYVQDEIDLNSELIKNPPATFLIRVQGNSMTDHKITNGDLLVVDRSLNLKNDCIAIINFNNELVVKNIIKENNNFYIKNREDKTLINENSDINVWGIVTYIIHAAH